MNKIWLKRWNVIMKMVLIIMFATLTLLLTQLPYTSSIFLKSDAKHYGSTSSSVLHTLQECLSDFSSLPRCCPTPQQWPQGRLAIMTATCFTQFTYCKNTFAQKHTWSMRTLTLALTVFLSPCRAVLQMLQMGKCYLRSTLGQKPFFCIRAFTNENTLGWKLWAMFMIM